MSADNLERLLEESPVVLMDGGMGTTLEDRGTHCRSALWSSYALLSEAGRAGNERIHAEYVEAGADILIANTHNAGLAACRAFLAGDGPAVDLPEDIRGAPQHGAPEALLAWIHDRALEGVRRAVPAGSEVVLAAGIGSAEGPYATESRQTPDQIVEALEPQLLVLMDRGVDLVLFETLTTRSEIEAVALLARRNGITSYGAGLTCGADGRTLAGVAMGEAWDILAPASPAAVFVQCTRFDLAHAAFERLVVATGGATIPGVYANDGRTWSGRRWHGERVTPGAYADEALRWRDAGARIIGGCCGTSPEHVAELRRRLA